MPLLRSIPIRIKLTLLLMITSTLAVLMVCLMFYILLSRHYQEVYAKDLDSLADILSHNCTVPLLFNVPEDAEEVLRSVDDRTSIVAVRLYDQDHNLFAAYENRATVPVRRGVTAIAAIPDDHNYLRVEHPVALRDGSQIGTLVILDDVHDVTITKRQGAYVLAGSALVALVGAFGVATLLQRRISRPLSELTGAVQRLASGDLAAWRDVPCFRSDELGRLSTSFVNMGRRLESSYSQLSEYSQTLEKRVAERTEELQKALAQLTESQAQLVQSEKMAALGQLVAGVAHEINNNINFISCAIPSLGMQTKRLSAQLSAAGDGGRCDHAEIARTVRTIELLLDNADEGVRRTVKIVSDLRNFAYPSQGQCSEVDIHQELDMVLALLDFDIGGRIKIRREYDRELPKFFCLRDQMNQVYMNVLRNAIQSIDGPGTISIATWMDRGRITIRFRDSGCGIPEAIRSKIFDPFFTTKEIGQGNGLGLAISYSIVKKHGGQILVESSGPEGTAIVVRIPVDAEALMATPRGTAMPEVRHPGPGSGA